MDPIFTFVAIICLTIMFIFAAHNPSPIKKALNQNPHFSPTIKQRFADSSNILIDENTNLVLFVPSSGKFSIFKFSEILEVSLQRDGLNVTTTDRLNQAGAAAVGSLLLGPIGLLAGALSSRKRGMNLVSSIKIRLVIKNIRTPVIEICTYGGRPVNADDIKPAIALANEWYARLRAASALGDPPSFNTERNLDRTPPF